MGETFLGTYLGCEMWYMTPPHVPAALYRSACVPDTYGTLDALKNAIKIALAKGEFIFAAYTPFIDTREIFPVGAPWPSVTKTYKPGDSVYVHYAVKNIARVEAGKPTITVKDRGTGSIITTWSIPELAPNERFKTSGSGAYVGKMPSTEWRLEFKVEP